MEEEKEPILYEKSCFRIERNQVVSFCQPASDHFCLGYVLMWAILTLEGCPLPSLFTHSGLPQTQLRWLFLDKTLFTWYLPQASSAFLSGFNSAPPNHLVMIHTRDPDSGQALTTSRKKIFQTHIPEEDASYKCQKLLQQQQQHCYRSEILPTSASWQVSLP